MKFHTLLAAAACMLLSTQAFADVTVYRAADKKNGTFAKIADAQWRVDEPDGVSTFEAANLKVSNKACKVSFNILGVDGGTRVQGTQGQVEHMPVGYVATYTPNFGGEGHWSISGPMGTLAATVQTAITTYVIAQHTASVNQGYKGTASLCQTPTEAN